MHAAPVLAGNSHGGVGGAMGWGGRSQASGGQNTFRTAEVIYTTSRRQTHVNTTGKHKKGGRGLCTEGGGAEGEGGVCFE